MITIISALLSFSVLVSPAYTPPDNGNPDTERDTGTGFQVSCKHRGESHKEGC